MKKSELRQLIREEIRKLNESTPLATWLRNKNNLRTLARHVKGKLQPGDQAYSEDPMKWGTVAWMDWIESDRATQEMLYGLGVDVPGFRNRP